jgi:DNA-binding CsgD family transcriptional regulator
MGINKKMRNNYEELLARAGDFSHISMPSADELSRRFGFTNYTSQLQNTLWFILDYTQQRYLAFDPFGKDAMGFNIDYVLDAGPAFVTGLKDKNDFKAYNTQIVPVIIDILKKNPGKGSADLLFNTNYRMKKKNGDWVKLNQKSIFVETADDGTPLLAVGIATDITDFKTNNNILFTVDRMSHDGLLGKKESLYKSIIIPDEREGMLTPREIEIMKWICEGYSSRDIAERLHNSIHTINNHRKNILEKTNAKNLTEVIVFAVRNQIL